MIVVLLHAHSWSILIYVDIFSLCVLCWSKILYSGDWGPGTFCWSTLSYWNHPFGTGGWKSLPEVGASEEIHIRNSKIHKIFSQTGKNWSEGWVKLCFLSVFGRFLVIRHKAIMFIRSGNASIGTSNPWSTRTYRLSAGFRLQPPFWWNIFRGEADPTWRHIQSPLNSIASSLQDWDLQSCRFGPWFFFPSLVDDSIRNIIVIDIMICT